jgi:small subunit ribosomal protein S8
MPAHDTISDMLTRIRNACAVRHRTVNIPSTRMTRNIADVLIEEGFINGYEEVGEGVKKKYSCILEIQRKKSSTYHSQYSSS